MKGISFVAHQKDDPYFVSEPMRKVYSALRAVYLPKETGYFVIRESAALSIPLSTIGGSTSTKQKIDMGQDSQSTCYNHVSFFGGGKLRTQVRQKQNPESLLSYPIRTEPGVVGWPDDNYDPFVVPLEFWTPEWIFGMLLKYPSYIDIVRDLGKTFVEAEALAVKSGRPSQIATLYPKSVAGSLKVVRKAGPALPLLKVEDAIANWLNDFSYRGWQTHYLIYENPIDIEALTVILGDGLIRFITECIQPITMLLATRDDGVELVCQRAQEFWYFLPFEVKLTVANSPFISRVRPVVRSFTCSRNLFMDHQPAGWYAALAHWNPLIWYKGEAYTVTNFLYGSCPPVCALLLADELVNYVVDGIVNHELAVLAALELINLPSNADNVNVIDIIAGLTKNNLTEYIDKVNCIGKARQG
jgi:hypothetical protein